MIPDYLTVAGRIRTDIEDLAPIVERSLDALQRAGQSGDQLYLDAVALNLHSFYSGIERLFELISTSIDGTRPGGEHWHQDLLRQVASPIPQTRPAVLRPATRDRLGEYLGFRHVVRNVYSFNLDPSRLSNLAKNLPELYAAVRLDLLTFADELERFSNATDTR